MKNFNRPAFLFILFLSGALSAHIFAQTPEQLFEQGNVLYRAGDYRGAAALYDSIINQGYRSAGVYFNLGNSRYRLEQLAQAILAYERAARLRPHDPDIEHNLRLLSFKTIDRIEPVPEIFFVQWMRAVGSLLSAETVKVLFLLFWILFFVSLAILSVVVRSGVLRAARILMICSFVCICVWGVLMGIQSLQDTTSNDSIITGQTVTAKSSPDAKSVDAFVIHEGLKVKMTDAVAGWVKITLADGKVGWIEAAQCEKI
ncbi:MAG: tetratricopeptide repeat protein [Bacteroidota bacterium]